MMAPIGSKSNNYLAYVGSLSSNAHQRSLLPPADINKPIRLSYAFMVKNSNCPRTETVNP